jgi:dihydrofolate reductase
VRGLTGSIYGRRMYETMRYWDEDLPDWDAEDRDFAVAWRSQPKWVVSRSLKSVGPNATLVADDFETVIRRLKAELAGEIQVAGPVLAQSLTEAGLIDEYRLYLRPVVLGSGSPFFAGPRPPPRAENAPQEVGWKRAEIVSVCVDRLGITHTRVEPQHFRFQSCVRYKETTKQLRGRKIDPQGSDAAHIPGRKLPSRRP